MVVLATKRTWPTCLRDPDMATVPEPLSSRQLWLDVDRPIAVKPRRDRVASRTLRTAAPSDQMEFRMVPAAKPPVPSPPIERSVAVPATVPGSVPDGSLAEPFGTWLLEQAKRLGMVGELAKAVRLDRRFPKTGSADAVRRYFGSIGAEGDAFEALDDAEREYDRL